MPPPPAAATPRATGRVAVDVQAVDVGIGGDGSSSSSSISVGDVGVLFVVIRVLGLPIGTRNGVLSYIARC